MNAYRKTLLAIALAVAANGVNAAVTQSSDQKGEVLLFPYYTANGGWSTLISIVNTGNDPLAVRVRHREGRAGQDVQSLNLYLDAFDTWTAVIYDPDGDANGPAAIATQDTSCTVPAIRGNEQLPMDVNGSHYWPFQTGHLDDGREMAATFSDFAAETRDGFIEVIELGTVSGSSAQLIDGSDGNCAELAERWAPGGTWSTDPQLDVNAPQGNLTGQVTLINPLEARAMGARPTVLRGLLFGSQHSAPQDASPSVATGEFQGAETQSLVMVGDNPVVTTWSRPLDAIQAVLSVDQLHNEFLTSGGIESEWIITLPTKPSILDGLPSRPFDEAYGEVAPGEACIATGAFSVGGSPVLPGFVFDRSGQVLTDPDECADPEAGDKGFGPTLCFYRSYCEVTNNFEFNGTSMFSSARPVAIDTQAGGDDAADGWAYFWFLGETMLTHPEEDNVNVEGHVYRGLPAIGFMAAGLSADAIIPGVVSNFGLMQPHVIQTEICTEDCEDFLP